MLSETERTIQDFVEFHKQRTQLEIYFNFYESYGWLGVISSDLSYARISKPRRAEIYTNQYSKETWGLNFRGYGTYNCGTFQGSNFTNINELFQKSMEWVLSADNLPTSIDDAIQQLDLDRHDLEYEISKIKYLSIKNTSKAGLIAKQRSNDEFDKAYKLASGLRKKHDKLQILKSRCINEVK